MSIAKTSNTEPTPRRRTIRELEPTIGILRQHPGRWARVAEGASAPAIQSLRNRYGREGFEFVRRSTNRIYGRYAPADSQPRTPAVIWEEPPSIARRANLVVREIISEPERRALLVRQTESQLSHDRIATRIGKSRRWVGDRLRGRTPISPGDQLLINAAIDELTAEAVTPTSVAPEAMSQRELDDHLDELVASGQEDIPAFERAYDLWERRS